MITKYKNKTNIFVGIGLVFQILWLVLNYVNNDKFSNLAFISLFVGIVLFTIGCVFYAKGKGYPGLYGLLGLVFNLFGILILVIIPDKFKNVQQDVNQQKF